MEQSLRWWNRVSIIVIDRDFLNHDQTGSCESIVFIKGRKEEWKGMQIRFFASTIPLSSIVYSSFKFEKNL